MSDYNDTQLSGYLEVKQSSKVKGRQIKAWRRRWVVVKKLADLAAGTQSARIDLYPSDPSTVARQGQGQNDRLTFVLDQLSGVQHARSRTRPYAFELVELDPVLVLSGSSREVSDEWMAALNQMFFADSSLRDTDSYRVTVQPNRDSLRFQLSGDYTLTICPEGVTLRTTVTQAQHQHLSLAQRFLIEDLDHPGLLENKTLKRSSSFEGYSHTDIAKPGGSGIAFPGEMNDGQDTEEALGEEVLSWRLSMLKKFDVERKGFGQPLVFLFDCGPNSPTGEATFRLITDEAYQILASFRKSISIAMERRRHLERYASTPDLRPSRTRTVSTVMGYQALLAQSSRSHTITAGIETGFEPTRSGSLVSRSWSLSSSSTATPSSPTIIGGGDFGDSGMGEVWKEKGVPVMPPRQRISTVSMPVGLLSSSPGRSSESFGRLTPSSGLSSSPKTYDTFGSSFVQRQQQQQIQQQQQQMLLQQQPMQEQPGWPMQQQQQQQVAGLPLRKTSFAFPPYPLSLLPPLPGSPEHEQQLQAWLQQQQEFQQPENGWSPQVGKLLSLRRNSSVPSVFTIAGDLGDLDQVDSDVLSRRRTSSLTADRPFTSGSICSADSGVVTDPANPRKGSNSFASTVSSESSRSGRKVSEGVDTIHEAPSSSVASHVQQQSALPCDDKLGTSPDAAQHVYQDLDSVKAEALRRRSSCALEAGMGRRRHSTGDVSHNSDYEELDMVKRAIASANNALGEWFSSDQPPELPARPPSFFRQGSKSESHGRRGLMSAVGILRGLRSLSVRDSSYHSSSSQETLTSSGRQAKDRGPLSHSGSSSLYDSIDSIGIFQRPSRRSSSSITPVASHPDLRVPSSLRNSSETSPGLSSSVDYVGGPGGSGVDGAGVGGKLLSRPQSLNLLSFSDGGEVDSHPRGKRGSKSALLDFFLDDTSFHSNPMVTGDLMTQQWGLKSLTSTTTSISSPQPPPTPRSRNPPAFSELSSPTTTEGWADFSDLSPSSMPSSNPFSDSSSWARFTPPDDSWALGKWADKAEPVYIEMRSQCAQDGGDVCEYVASESILRDQAFEDFQLFQ